jgi:hypothetical protein
MDNRAAGNVVSDRTFTSVLLSWYCERPVELRALFFLFDFR